MQQSVVKTQISSAKDDADCNATIINRAKSHHSIKKTAFGFSVYRRTGTMLRIVGIYSSEELARAFIEEVRS